ncbi:LytTR family DNA-binding domain-containing protein [Paenibacillus sp. S150]|uniref:LytTR family DNA-binding domain-containing protein n=1 Tax=Paenibacillus sp. S150 TaxID=2749826 RepID=UPI001C563584|nr:LytTR family DNA-binding domain-containing protein [Paenibacillus sp. S150]MBW4083564.1 LytTR family transcriptional regulator DNA-binding domain-containing protein [Paenibacillus sp. S150]
MIYVTVTESEDGSGIQQIPVDEILYMQFDNRLFISVQTEDAQYVTTGALRYWESAFEKAGLNFLRLDRGVLANLDNIQAVDSVFKIAYFGVGKKKCTMSSSGFKELNKKMVKGSSWQTSPSRDVLQK